MDLRGALRARLLANATISGLVTKVAWGGLPEKTTLPYIRLTKAAPGQDWTHEGPDPLERPWVQIDIYAGLTANIGTIADAVQAEMQRLTDTTIGGWTFKPPASLVSDQGPEVEDLTCGGQGLRVTHDYRFWACPA